MKRAPAALALALLAAGCMGRVAPPRYYTLALPATAEEPAAAGASEGLVIGVETFAVEPPYDQDRLVYRRSLAATEVGFHDSHRWATSPGRLVAAALARGLGGTPGIASIEPATALGDYTARLSGRVLYLEEVGEGAASSARVGIELKLADAAGESLWTATLAASVNGGERMQRMRAAFSDVLLQAQRRLAVALLETP